MTSSHPLPAVVPLVFPPRRPPSTARSAPRLACLFLGAVLARGRRTVTSWIRAAGLSDEFRPCYTTVAAAGKRADRIAARLAHAVVKPLVAGADRLTFALDDTPTQRYGPHVQGAGVHHNPTPGPAGAPFVYGHVWVVLGLLAAHPAWGVDRPAAAGPAVRPREGPGRHRPEAPAGVPDQAGAGRRAGAVGEDVAGAPGQAAVGGGRRGVRQGPVPQADAGAGGDGGQPAPQGRGPVDRARAAAAGPARPAPDLRRAADRPGQAGRAAPRVGDRDVRPVREADGEAVQDVRGDVAAGRRGDPGGAGGRADGVGGVLLHRPVGHGGRHPGGGGRPVQRWRPRSATARRSSGRASSRCGSCGRASGRSTSACGRSR